MRLPIGIPLIVKNVKITGPSGSVSNGVIEVPKLQLQEISIGSISARDVEVICHDIPELAGLRSLLGLNFLKNFCTVIDYKKGFLEIS